MSAGWIFRKLGKGWTGTALHRSARRAGLCLLGAGVLASAATVRAEVSWVGGVGSYYTGSNWSGGFVPAGDNPVVIGNGGTAQSDNYSGAESLTIGGGSTLAVLPGIVSQFSVFDSVYIGSSGTGTVTIGAEALLATGNFYAGYSSLSNGVVSMSRATLSPDRFYAGYDGNATVTLEDGSTLESTHSYVGYAAASQGLVQLSNSTWTVEEQGLPVDLTVGVSGQGDIQATASRISSQNLTLAANAAASGIVALSGGTLTVQNQILVGDAGSGTFSLTNAASASSAGMSLGAQAGSSGQASFTNSRMQSSANVFVGLSGSGTLAANGSQIEAPELFIGRQSGATGTVTITGGTTTLTGELHVGAEGTGTFTLNGGGVLNSDRGNMGFADGAVGEAHIDNGHWHNTQAIFVGVSGSGTLHIGAAGSIASESGYISQNAAGHGVVAVNSGSWTMTNTLAVGVNGTGELSATGGVVSAEWTQIGLNAGSQGTVTLDNAALTTTETLTIGSGGDGELTAVNGSTVTAGSVQLAASANVTASLVMTNSTLTTENLIASNAGATAEFSGVQWNLLGGASVLDTLLIDGFAPGAVVVGSGGLTINTQGGNAEIVSSLAGTGALTKTGEGRLRLNSENTYSGGTAVAGGVLEIGASNVLGTGTTTLGSGELRAIANVTLSNSQPGVAVQADQTGTISANTGNTFTLATTQLTLGNGAGLQFGSDGHAGTVVFAPENLSMPSGSNQLVVQSGTLQAGNGRLEEATAAAESTTIAAGATLAFQDQLSGAGINALFGAGTVHTGTLSSTSLTVQSGTFSGSIAGNGALVKESAGTLVLS
ncbi:MAG TPA: autotransporter-associated beta strand repeat-containing protein, partial [Terrimicrobiaceae bacterium]|nr:autotransporter-associated beta strand repeat-containing protein [Terrimicrobiaceae bacterium]